MYLTNNQVTIFISLFTECLKAYQEENNGVLPERIIVYRDGVGEGQLQHVYDVEIKEVQVTLIRFKQNN